jgi:TolB-like protein/DNA-binding winged helix-turn-helix (wHTH) protein/Tfp pilus assembly protein PilF
MDAGSPSQLGAIRFGVFEVDLRVGELRKQGVKIKLQDQPFQLLQVLLERPGEVVTREELRQRIWPADTFVDFDGGVNNAVKRLREALGDKAETPRFIETLPRRGYRLIATVNANALSPAVNGSQTGARFSSRTLRVGILIGLGSALLLLGIAGFAPSKWWLHLRGSGVPQIRSLAVLPLQNLSGDQTQEYFADAMTEELITELSRLSALRVVSRTSVMRYKKTDKPLPEIARELGVDGIVEGSVVRSGARVRVTAQLIYAPRDSNLWAQNYDGDLSDVLTLQSSVATAIAEEIQAKMTPQEQQHLMRLRPVNHKALDSYLEGRFHLARASDLQIRKGFEHQFAEEERKAVADFEQAIQDDPHYVPAYLAIFEMTNLLDAVPDLDSKARAVVARVLEMDDSVAEAHLDHARLLLGDWNWPAAEQEYKRALELNPSSADAHLEYSNYLDLMAGERTPASQKELETAQRLDPVNDRSGDFFPAVWSLDQKQRYVDEQQPNNWFLRALLGKEFQIAGRYKEAVNQYMKTLKMLGYENQARILQDGYVRDDYKGAIRAWLKVYVATSNSHRMPKYFPAWLYSNLGDKEEAFALLEQAYKEHDGIMIHLKDDPIWAPIRSDPKFKELIRRVGLPP